MSNLQCPYCKSKNIIKKGFKKGAYGEKQRYKCKDCNRHFTNTPSEEYPLFFDKKTPEKVNWRDWLDNLIEHKDLHQKTSVSQDEATIELPVKKNIIVFSGDWHLGSLSVSYQEFRKNTEMILNTPDVYMVTVGDLINDFKSFYSLQPVLSQIASPKEQLVILKSICQEFVNSKKWLASCWGNHDNEFDEKIFGQSPVKELLGEHFVFFNGKGRLNIIIGDQKYIIELSHSYRGHSIYNPTHGQNRQLKWYSPDADIIVGGHYHTPAIQWFYAYGQRKCLIQVGSFQQDDGYSKRWFEPGVIGVPAAVLCANRHEISVYPSLEEFLEK